MIGWWVLTLCSCISWHQCFGVMCWLYVILWENKVQVDTEMMRVRMWCNCVGRLQQMRTVRIVGRWEDLKDMAGSALLQLLLAQAEGSILLALSGVLTGHIACNVQCACCTIALHCHYSHFNINVDPVSSFQRQRLACSAKPSLSHCQHAWLLHGVKTWKGTEWSDLLAGHIEEQ